MLERISSMHLMLIHHQEQSKEILFMFIMLELRICEK